MTVVFGDEDFVKPQSFAELQRIFDVNQDVQIEIFGPKDFIVPEYLDLNNLNSILKSKIDSKAPTRIIIHGFQSQGEFKRTLIEAFFLKGKRNVNLIAINWEKASNIINYFKVRDYVDILGNFTAKFIDFTVENNIIKFNELSVIGHSLGAHIAGIAGKTLQSDYKKKLRKIVALDPAEFLFSIDKPKERLDSTDAIYVECIHTSDLGFFLPLGNDVSFYPNGGKSQPQCRFWELGCSHSRAYQYYAQSVSFDEPLFGYQCESLEDVENGNCKGNVSIFGGEPGAIEQQPGIYYIKI